MRWRPIRWGFDPSRSQSHKRSSDLGEYPRGASSVAHVDDVSTGHLKVMYTIGIAYTSSVEAMFLTKMEPYLVIFWVWVLDKVRPSELIFSCL